MESFTLTANPVPRNNQFWIWNTVDNTHPIDQKRRHCPYVC